nr:CoA ester lyase [Mycolicibacterium helvum]
MAERIAFARSVLFVPGDRPDRFGKAVASGADLVVVDLEDAVGIEDKLAARAAVDQFLGTGVPVAVRINGSATEWFDGDVETVSRRQCAVMVPKAHSVSELEGIADRLSPGTPLIALIETAAGVHAAPAICAVEAVARAAFGSVDLGAEVGVDPALHEPLLYARSALVLASAAAGRPAPLDGVTTDLSSAGPLSADVDHAVRLGFGGKLCIHPGQIAVVNERFSPSPAELEWAHRVTAEASGGKVCVVDGKMVDKPVLDRAARILARAR